MSQDFDRPVCASCGKVFNDQLDDGDQWHKGYFDIVHREAPVREGEPDHLCPECYPVIVEGEPGTREWKPTTSS